MSFQNWFKKNTPKEGLSENTTFTRQFVIDAWDNGYCEGYNKANEWHDLRKNPNDLPPKMIANPNFSIDVLSDIGEIVCFNFTANEWFYWRHKKPIAWCEIPKFEGD